MPYNVYQDNELIEEGIAEKEYTVKGLTPNTEYSFFVSETIGDKESERSEAIIVKTNYSDPTAVEVSPKTNNLEVAATRNLTATVTPSTAIQTVKWSSSDAKIATVDANGKVTAIAAGTATITAESTEKNTIKGTATVTVTAPEPEPDPEEPEE